jgi:outer membrane translocation and assembly module TamA
VSVAVEQAGSFLPGTFTYTEVSGEVRHYASTAPEPLRASSTRRGVVFAQRLRASTIDAPAPTDAAVPFFKRYFLGGSTSLRGWGRYEVSPLTESGQPIGGLTLLEASSEVRFPLANKLSFVGFVDAGSVGRLPWRLDSGGLRVDAGPGLRYDTPIGPARLDLGYQLNPIPNLLVKGEPEARRWRVHISIGQAF